MAVNKKLLALAATFGIIAEGLTAEQLQEALGANSGYQAYTDAESKLATATNKIVELEKALEVANIKPAVDHGPRILELEAELDKVNQENDDLILELNKSEATILNLSHLVKPQIAATDSIDTEAPAVIDAPTHFVYNGRKYGFTPKAPKKLSFHNQIFTQEEFLNNADAMTSLIVGGNAFVKQII